MPYPVTVHVEPALTNRSRLTTFFRIVLAVPHIILVGGVGIGFASRRGNAATLSGEGGLIGAVAVFLAVVSWVTILVTGTHIIGIRQMTTFYMRWRLRALAYLTLLEDGYPPFGDGPYPTSFEVTDPAGPRDRFSVAIRFILVIPHVFVLLFVMLAWGLTTFVAWFVIVFTGTYPKSLYEFGVGSLRWVLRVQAYLLLLVDDYPPFSLE
jgi:hypothetical protein